MLFPKLEKHPSLDGFAFKKQYTKSVGVNFGMSDEGCGGSIAVNGRKCLRTVRDKVSLMTSLEAANIPVPQPIRSFSEFYHERSFDAVTFKTNMAYPVVARRYGQSFYIGDDTDLLHFLGQRQNTDFVLFCMTMEKYKLVEVTVCPLLGETIIVKEGVRYEHGIIHVDGAGNIKKSRKSIEQTCMTTAKIIGMDVGTVVVAVSEDESEYQVMDVHLHPNKHTLNVLEEVVAARILKGNRY